MMASPTAKATLISIGQRAGRLAQNGARQNAFEQLRVNFDARHRTIDGRRLIVEQTDRRSAHQDDLIGEFFAARLAVENVGGRHEARRVVRREMDEDLTARVGRQFEARQTDPHDPIGVPLRTRIEAPPVSTRRMSSVKVGTNVLLHIHNDRHAAQRCRRVRA